MKYAYKSCKLLYGLLAIIYIELCFGRYFGTYAASIKAERKRDSDTNDDTEHLTQSDASSIFTCHAKGNFENVNNHNSYWYCDMTSDGGFVAIRRTCRQGQTYDSIQKKCTSKQTRMVAGSHDPKMHGRYAEPKISYVFIVPETTLTEEEFKETTPIEPEIITAINEEFTETTTCDITTSTYSTTESTCSTTTKRKRTKTTTTTTSPRPYFTTSRHTKCSTASTCSPPKIEFKCDSEGVFPDPQNCNTFFICHKKRDFPRVFEKIKVKCPDGMAFDFRLGWCSPQARAKCKTIRSDELNNFLRLVNVDDMKHTRSVRKKKQKHNILYRILRKIRETGDNLPIHYINKRQVMNYRSRLDASDRNVNPSESFQCSAKGRFANPLNSNDYYICYQKEVGGYLSLKMKCPEGSSFVANDSICTPTE